MNTHKIRNENEAPGRRSLWTNGDMSPRYLWRGDVHGNVPPIFYKWCRLGCWLELPQETMSRSPRNVMTYMLYFSAWKVQSENMFLNVYSAARFILSSNSNNCCLLYFNANIMCSFTKSLSFFYYVGDNYRGSSPGPRWGTSVPQTLSLFCPPIILWDRHPSRHISYQIVKFINN